MAHYSKKRGVQFDDNKLSIDEKRRQWNINLAKRQLENMFGNIEIGDDVIIDNRRRTKVTYTADSLYEKAREYFENIVEANEKEVTIIPDVEDFCTFAKISRLMFMKYRRSDDVEMAEVANNISTAIAACKKQNAYGGLMSPLAFAMDMNNNHDYIQQRYETTFNTNISLQQVETNIADIAKRLPIEDIPKLENKESEK